MSIKYTQQDINFIIGKAVKTGYDADLDMQQMGQNFHAQDDTAYAVISLADLSTDAANDILTQDGVKEHLPINFDKSKIQIKFKWNVEWGDWSDVCYNGEKVCDFSSGLPFAWLGEGFHD